MMFTQMKILDISLWSLIIGDDHNDDDNVDNERSGWRLRKRMRR